MSTITLRFERDKDGWKNRSELTFHFEDWSFTYSDEGIEARPQPISLVWRICTAIIFLGIAGYFAFWLVSSLGRGDRLSHRSPAPRAAGVSVRPLFSTIAYQVAATPSRRMPDAAATDASLDELRRRTEELKQRLSPEARQRLEQREKERAERLQQSQRRIHRRGRILTVLMWIGYPLLILLILAFGWIGIRYGLLEIIRFPIDRVSIAGRQGTELVIQRPRLLGSLILTRPIAELAGICYEVRRIGGRGRRHHRSASYHWVATLHSRQASELPRIEFFIASQFSPPVSGQPVPERVAGFLRHLQRMTGCHLRQTGAG